MGEKRKKRAAGRRGAWRKAHPETWWKVNHPGEETDDVRRLEAWREENPERVALVYAGKADERRGGEGGSVTAEEWQRAIEFFGGCAYCGEKGDKLQVDHFVPLTKGGTFEAGNVIPACERCNKRKHNKRPEEFLTKEPGRLVIIRTYLTSLRASDGEWAKSAGLQDGD